jgi:hypothetical protein
MRLLDLSQQSRGAGPLLRIHLQRHHQALVELIRVLWAESPPSTVQLMHVGLYVDGDDFARCHSSPKALLDGLRPEFRVRLADVILVPFEFGQCTSV